MKNLFLAASVLVFAVTPAAGLYAEGPKQVCFNDQCVNVEVVDTEEARAAGLQGRASMPADHGMLFVFPDNDILDFWMKETLIPLDIIWLSDEYKIVAVKAEAQPCAADPCPVFTPSEVSRYVLEVNAKYVDAHGLKPGDRAVFK